MLTVTQASERLSVGEHEVRRLVHAGLLTARRVGRTFVLDEEPVDARARLSIAPGRPLAPATAWAALWELSGERVTWLEASSRSRLLAKLSAMTVHGLQAAVRERSDRVGLCVLPAYREQVLTSAGVVATGMSAAHEAEADVAAVAAPAEVCCTTRTLNTLTQRFALSPRGESNLVVHVSRFDALPLEGRHALPAAAVAADLASSSEVRTRRAGSDLLATLMTTPDP